MLTLLTTNKAAADLFEWAIDNARTPRLRTFAEFAEQEIVLPDGPCEGLRFRCDRQPYTRPLFDEFDRAGWREIVITGPSQSGKSLVGHVIPCLYHLFEMRERVVLAAPDGAICRDKWRENILPAIEATRFKSELPLRGEGSKGGDPKSAVKFRNGVTLRFMTGGGDDKSRAAFTSRVLVITETDGFDEVGSTSRESSKINQLKARTKAFGDRRRIYQECTVSTEDGYTWATYKQGSESALLLPCPHCGEYVLPERGHLVGWQDAETVLEARVNGAFACPECGAVWSEDDREQANAGLVLVHRGQSVERGDDGPRVVGAAPQTDVLGFRWTATHNLFVSARDLAAAEWGVPRAVDEEDAERAVLQFNWAHPPKPRAMDMTALTAGAIQQRSTPTPRGVLPVATTEFVGAIDLGKWACHYALCAYDEDGSPHFVDYGVVDSPADSMTVERAVWHALLEFRDMCLKGFERETSHTRVTPRYVLVDSGEWTKIAYAFCRQYQGPFLPSKGYGSLQRGRRYFGPRRESKTTFYIGDRCHVEFLPSDGVRLVEFNADHWKSWLHARMRTSVGLPGAGTLFAAAAKEHTTFAKHLVSERQVMEFVAGVGEVTRWDAVSRNNHYMDAAALCGVAGDLAGVRLISVKPQPAPPPRTPRPMARPDGRPFVSRRS